MAWAHAVRGTACVCGPTDRPSHVRPLGRHVVEERRVAASGHLEQRLALKGKADDGVSRDPLIPLLVELLILLVLAAMYDNPWASVEDQREHSPRGVEDQVILLRVGALPAEGGSCEKSPSRSAQPRVGCVRSSR
eukprot:2468992-Prymnesium_polylepis.3